MPKPETDHLSALPFELLSLILSHLPNPSLVSLTPVSRQLHHASLHQLHSRLLHATDLDSHTLILECYHPSAKLVASHLFCTSLGTPGLESPLDYEVGQEVGRLKHLCGLYTRFLPQRKEPEERTVRRHPAGDVPGSRTHPASRAAEAGTKGNGMLVAETVSLDAGELFSQLCCVTNLVKMAPGRRRLITNIMEVSDGMIRVWRDWLGRRNGVVGKKREVLGDEGILWVNNSGDSVGIKFRVKERSFRRDQPVLFASEDEVAVSYYIEFEELLIKTTYLLDKIERSKEQQSQEAGGRAIVFGSFTPA
ncbi:F-box domain-containing protein 3 [Elsinoe australis]|uniref:F-box domain-containing protein 3 n=1 Tax=Elsinoe australis TaxID=40998 RepID=A0A4U7B4R0_9PEZI|nr:F-box domain-containing protein 3 [Elsinoe australis]